LVERLCIEHDGERVVRLLLVQRAYEHRNSPLRCAHVAARDGQTKAHRLTLACDLFPPCGQRVELRLHMSQPRVEGVEVERRALHPLREGRVLATQLDSLLPLNRVGSSAARRADDAAEGATERAWGQGAPESGTPPHERGTVPQNPFKATRFVTAPH